jgi:NAD(P)-dependent dehydrogenase (short-subunit alcohol dehydrogenase family)
MTPICSTSTMASLCLNAACGTLRLITGASSGIGGATAVALADRGVDSIVTFNSHEDRVRDVVEAVRQRGAKAVPLRLDIGESAGFIAFRDEVIAVLDSEWKASSFDYLVNNAGFLQMALFEDTKEATRPVLRCDNREGSYQGAMLTRWLPIYVVYVHRTIKMRHLF